jgi:hypothetical protein
MKKNILILALLIILSGCGKKVTVKATVISHAILSNKNGNATYITIVNTDDGYIEELRGLNYYVVPVGKTLYVERYRPEK